MRREEVEKMFFSLFGESSAITYILDGVGLRIIDANIEAASFWGYEREELVGMPITAINCSSVSEMHSFVREVMDKKRSSFYFSHRLKNGDVRHVEAHPTILGTEEPGPLILVIVHDITERRKAEESLRASEERYRLIFDNSPMGIFQFDADGKVVACNRKFCDILGADWESIMNFDLFQNIENTEVRRALKRVRDGECADYDAVYNSQLSGKRTPVRACVHPVESDDNGFHGAVCIVEDTTERNEARERYSLVVEAASDVICTFSDKGAITSVNSAFEKLYGWRSEEVIGKEFSGFVHPEDRCCSSKLHAQVMKGEKPPIFEQRMIHSDGSYRKTQFSLSPLSLDGRITGVLSIARDVTEREKMERELQRVQKLESIGLLAGGIAHDFNNILSGIMGNISLAFIYAKEVKPAMDRLKEAERACIRAKDLTTQLLTFSKGGAPVKKRSSVREVVEESAIFALHGSSIFCDFMIDEGLPAVEIDEGQISQVIQNLVINAVQSMPGGGTIRIGGKKSRITKRSSLPLPPGNYIRIFVEDEGCGMSEEEISKIFDPFFSTKESGHGLGLTTSFTIAKKHGGHISVRSKEGEGSTFCLFLPALDRPAEKKPRSKVADSFSSRAKVLVMDDESSVRKIVSRILAHFGCTVETAKDGQEALDLYRQEKDSGSCFDMVIMDLTVPGGMGGREACEKLLGYDPDATCVVSSGYSNDPVMSDYKKYGFKSVISKPYTVDDIVSLMKEFEK